MYGKERGRIAASRRSSSYLKPLFMVVTANAPKCRVCCCLSERPQHRIRQTNVFESHLAMDLTAPLRASGSTSKLRSEKYLVAMLVM
jgi:hypothetical protein